MFKKTFSYGVILKLIKNLYLKTYPKSKQGQCKSTLENKYVTTKVIRFNHMKVLPLEEKRTQIKKKKHPKLYQLS